ncbi:hypothetical protein WN51_06266 [Melipona quadrifasciata]|uniref:Uncharacterized protein n=1 Tax=Melipona quadrifasciata TaxID=166423 RepID=A0A0N0BCE2_9HYME|nr:hypothetical protein WN51_06266 [Melipona quadrifasciata]
MAKEGREWREGSEATGRGGMYDRVVCIDQRGCMIRMNEDSDAFRHDASREFFRITVKK